MSYSPNFRGSQGKGSSRSLSTNFQNASGGTLAQSTPASVNSSGQLVGVDVSSDTSVGAIVGLCGADIPNAATGPVVDSGRLENVVLGFSVGDAIYISKAGFLTNVKPSLGVGGFITGDFIIFVGVVVKNEFNALQKDIQLMIENIGQI